MVGMEMGHQYARESPTADDFGEDFLPMGARFVQADAAVHRGPPLCVAQQPEIDVIERERQRHAQPVESRCDLANAAGSGRFREREGHRIGNVDSRRKNGSLHELIPVKGGAAL